MSDTAIVYGRLMIRVDEIPTNPDATKAARDILQEFRHGSGPESARRIEQRTEELAEILRDDGMHRTMLLAMMSRTDDSPGEYESLLSEDLARLRKLEYRLKMFRDGDYGQNPPLELIRALRDFVQSQGVRFRIPYLIGEEFELVDGVLESLGAVRQFVPAEVARRVGPVREDERKVLSLKDTVKMIMRLWPNEYDVFNVTGAVVAKAIEEELAESPKLAGFRVPKESTIGAALKEVRGYVKPRGAGRSKKLRDQAGAKRRNRKHFG